MDYFSRRQPIALPTTVEPDMSEKELLARSDSATQLPNSPAPCHKKSKFKKALMIVAHLFLFSVFLRVVSHKLHKHWHHHGHHRGPPHLDPHHHAPHGFRVFSDHDDLQCSTLADWSDPEELPPRHHGEPPLSSDTSFTLPASSESLLFYAHGSYSYGGIAFVEDDRLSSDDIIVDINVRYWNEEALEQANVCTVKREIGDGIGIFTPTERHRGRRHDELLFHITVRFPKSLKIKDLETVLPLFAHHFPTANLHFGTLTVQSFNFPIFAESLVVDSGKIRTTNNAIKGNFTVTDTLEITSSNSPISVNVAMKNADKEKPTKLFIGTSNAPLKSNIDLISTGSGGTGGEFFVETHTSNAPLEIRFHESPVDSVLQLSAKTSNSPAWVELHPAYEGTFDLKSSIFRPQISVDEHVEDPKGEGRHRKVFFNAVGKEIKGSVRWVGEDGDNTEKKGHVELASSVLAAHLRL